MGNQALHIRHPNLLLSLALAALTFAAFSRLGGFDFVNFDDPYYTTLNDHVRVGLTLDGARWAFTSTDTNWFPVTLLSHMLDFQLFGARPERHHLTSLVFHIAASLLLFAFLLRATRARWRSAFVAAIFALHPLHVESVAWISERKDVLCAFFWFLTLWIWAGYVSRPGWGRYLLALAAFSLGLMSKPMIVTLPFLLLLLDKWPFERKFSWKLVWEKIPFGILAAVAAVLTVIAQREGGAVRSLVEMPPGLRIENALVTLVVYIFQTILPVNLSVIYLFPTHIPVWQPVAAGIALAAVSVAVWHFRRPRPWIVTGWLWYLGTLVPVIGIVQVGIQARADRYMYVPMVGLAIVAAWSAAECLERRPRLLTPAAVAAVAICVAMALATWAQTAVWRNSETLFGRAIALDPANYPAWFDLGAYFADKPDGLPKAISLYEAALRIQPDYAPAHAGLGTALMKARRLPEAIGHLRQALAVAPDVPRTHEALALALLSENRIQPAIDEFEEVLKLNPADAEAHNNLGTTLLRVPGRAFDALSHLEEAVRIRPGYAKARLNLGYVLARIPGRMPDAIDQFEEALRIAPDPAMRKKLDLLEAAQRPPGRRDPPESVR